jgi:hypothetical protein
VLVRPGPVAGTAEIRDKNILEVIELKDLLSHFISWLMSRDRESKHAAHIQRVLKTALREFRRENWAQLRRWLAEKIWKMGDQMWRSPRCKSEIRIFEAGATVLVYTVLVYEDGCEQVTASNGTPTTRRNAFPAIGRAPPVRPKRTMKAI